MRMLKIGLVAALALAGLVAWTTSASAQDAKEKKGERRGYASAQERVDRMATELKLTDDQKTKVKALFEEQGKKMQEMRGDGVTSEQRREKFQSMRDEMNKKMKEILTPEQQTKWEKMREEMRGKGGPGGEKKGKKKTE